MSRFSLILGTAHRTRELGRFLASLDRQSHRDFELILVDQNPDDRLLPVIAPYQDRFEIRHLRSEPGLSRAKNLGLASVRGEIVGFPDDDCQFPGDILRQVARFLEDNPGWDGLIGASQDEAGRDSNGGFDREAGEVDRFNVWRRGIAYNIFVRAKTARAARFDEEMGPGSGGPWGAGDETDYLLKLLDGGAALFYDPGLVVIHPRPFSRYDSQALYRARSYARGGSHTIKKHGFPPWFVGWWLVRTLGGLALCLLDPRRRLPEARYRLSIFRGKLEGLLD